MNCIITGASKGIGFEIVKYLAQNADHQILALSRNIEQLETLLEDAPHNNVEVLKFDLQDQASDALIAILEGWNSIDVLINNAGYLVHKPFEELSSDDWRSIYEVNVLGPVTLINTCLPYLKNSSKAHVVNISSMGGIQGSAKFSGLSAYSSAKGAMSILSECLAEEWKETHISVNALALGAVQTEMLESAFPGYQAPLHANEMAEYIAWFAQNGHKYYNGKVLPVSVSTP